MTLRTDYPAYSTAHRRVRAARGKAFEFRCIDCGGVAEEWSYNHRDPNPLTEIIRGREVHYSANVENYDPRCRSCHQEFDRPLLPEVETEALLACGTYAGAQQHMKRRTPMCLPCRLARNQYIREWRQRKAATKECQ